METNLYSKLFDYQKSIVDKFINRHSLGLFLDMGLGKTLTSLAFAEVHNCTKVIVITINAKAEEDRNLKDSWIGWASQSSISYRFWTKHDKDFVFDNNTCDMLLINYESLFSRSAKNGIELHEKVKKFISSCRNNNVAIIVDESHKMKNLQSKQTKAIFLIKKLLTVLRNNIYTYLLTGTPFTTGYIDLYAQLKMLGYDATKTEFIDRFCERANIPGLLGWQQPIAGYKNIDELYATVHKYAITIRSEEVVNLPEQVFVNHKTSNSHAFYLYCTEQVEGRQILDELKARKVKISKEDELKYDVSKKVNNPFFRNIAYPDLKWIGETTGVAWLRARQLSIGFQGNADDSEWFDRRRLEQIKEFLETYPDNYVIFYNYTAELFELADICFDLDYNVDVFCGDIKSLEHYTRYSNQTEAQQLTNKKNVIIANFASGSTGMNWQKYSKVIITSIPLYKDYAQAIKRVHRPGQKETVIYHTFFQTNFLDYRMMHLLKEQKDYNEDMFEADLARIAQLISAAKSLDNVDSIAENEQGAHLSDFLQMILTNPECKRIADSKQIDTSVFLGVSTVEEYNRLSTYDLLTEEEFNTLKYNI